MKKTIKEAMNTFSFAQMTSNGDGKTSASGTMGVLVVLVGTFAFLLGIIDKMFFSHDVDIITQTIVFTGIGASLLGLRKYKSTIPVNACDCPEGCNCGNCERCS